MFKRRKPLRWHHHLKEWVWPTAGWNRMGQYLGHRVARIPDTASSIAAGLAWGAAISFTPLIGFHLILSMGLSWVFRANIAAAAIGTLVGNPWTFPLIWLAVYNSGVAFSGAGGDADILQLMREFNIFENPYQTLKPVLTPLLLGSIPYMILVWVGVFFPVRGMIRTRKKMRIKKLRKKRENDQAS